LLPYNRLLMCAYAGVRKPHLFYKHQHLNHGTSESSSRSHYRKAADMTEPGLLVRHAPSHCDLTTWLLCVVFVLIFWCCAGGLIGMCSAAARPQTAQSSRL
jgi:hypothetical protein